MEGFKDCKKYQNVAQKREQNVVGEMAIDLLHAGLYKPSIWRKKKGTISFKHNKKKYENQTTVGILPSGLLWHYSAKAQLNTLGGFQRGAPQFGYLFSVKYS